MQPGTIHLQDSGGRDQPYRPYMNQGARFSRAIATGKAFVSRDLLIASRYKLQFLFQFAHVFFAVAVIHFIGKMVEASGHPRSLQGYGNGYFAFALVGLAVDSYLQAGVVTVTNNTRQSMNQGVLEAMAATPMASGRLLFYSALWPFVFETVRVLFYFLTGFVVFGLRLPEANWPAAVLVLAVTIPIFMMLGVMSSAIIVVVKRGDPINWFFSRASAILAGTMFPLSVLPPWLRGIAQCLPLTHSLEATRKCLLTGARLSEVRGHLFALVVFTALLAPLTFFVTAHFMKLARDQGSFATH